MSYYHSTILPMRFADSIAAVKEALHRHHFHVVSEIDLQQTFKKQLNLEFKPYVILGVCNPQFTHRLLEVQEHVGAMLPCNVIIFEKDKSSVEVSVVDPVASMQAIEHVTIQQIATNIRSELYAVINELEEGSKRPQ